MRIATFNANSVRSRLTIILDWLGSAKPDILCLQETKVIDAEFPLRAFQSAGWHVLFRGEKSYNGVAIVSRTPPDDFSFGFDDSGPADETRLVRARFGNLHVVNTYVPQGREIENPMYAYKLKWFQRLRSLFDANYSPKDHVAWLGDLNVAPDAIDIHNASEQENHVCFHADVRKAFAHTLAWGFTDVFRKHHPEPGQYSFFDYRTLHAVDRNMGWRVDHILCTKPLAAKSRDSFIDLEPRKKEKPSDHTFMVADFPNSP